MKTHSSSFRRGAPLCAPIAAALLALAGGERAAAAQDSVAAQALYDRAVELMNEKNFAEACPKLEEVTRLIPDGLGAKLTLAECYEADDKLASAWTQYSFVESSAARLGQTERQRVANEKAAALKPKLAHLTIEVPDVVKKMPGLTITRAGKPVGPAQWDEAIPIDQGSHEIVAIAAGKRSYRLEAKIPADGASLTIAIPVLADDPKARLVDPPPGGAATPVAGASEPTWLFPLGLAVGGLGVGSLAAGGALGGLAMSASADAENACPSGRCSRDGNDLRLQAGTFADASTALFVAGGVLAGAGVVMVVLSPTVQGEGDKKEDKPPRAALRILPAGLRLEGSF